MILVQKEFTRQDTISKFSIYLTNQEFLGDFPVCRSKLR